MLEFQHFKAAVYGVLGEDIVLIKNATTYLAVKDNVTIMYSRRKATWRFTLSCEHHEFSIAKSLAKILGILMPDSEPTTNSNGDNCPF